MRRLFSSVQRSERTLGCARSSSAAASTQPAVHAAKARSAPRRQRPHRAARPRAPAARAIASPALRSPLRSSRGGEGEGRREGKLASRHSVLGVPVLRGDPLSASATYPPWPPFHFLLHFSSPRLSLSLLWMASLLPSFLDCRPLSSRNTCPFPGPHWTHSPSWLLHSAHPHPLHQV